MNYAKVENGQVTQVGLPSTGTLKDGSTVSGYDKLPETQLFEEGWKQFINDIPEYNPETEYLEYLEDINDLTTVVRKYEVKQIPVQEIPQEKTIEEKIAELEVMLAVLKSEIGM